MVPDIRNFNVRIRTVAPIIITTTIASTISIASTITIIIVITLEVGTWRELWPKILIHVSPSPSGSMAIGSQAGEGDLAFSIIKPRVPEGLDKGKSLIKSSVSHALVIEALIEALLDQIQIFKV